QAEDGIRDFHVTGVQTCALPISWNDNRACRIGWTCDYHLDINTQMNYWIAELTNLSACHQPLFRWIEETLVPSGRHTARTLYDRSEERRVGKQCQYGR